MIRIESIVVEGNQVLQFQGNGSYFYLISANGTVNVQLLNGSQEVALSTGLLAGLGIGPICPGFTSINFTNPSASPISITFGHGDEPFTFNASALPPPTDVKTVSLNGNSFKGFLAASTAAGTFSYITFKPPSFAPGLLKNVYLEKIEILNTSADALVFQLAFSNFSGGGGSATKQNLNVGSTVASQMFLGTGSSAAMFNGNAVNLLEQISIAAGASGVMDFSDNPLVIPIGSNANVGSVILALQAMTANEGFSTFFTWSEI